MREEILFEITKGNLETGLRGVPVGYCVTSFVDPYKGLTYVGRPISELCYWEPIEVIYLLYYGETGSKEQIALFQQELNRRSLCKKETLEVIESLPATGHPMDLLAAALLLAGMHELDGDYREDCLNLIAKIPEITAAVINRHAGWGKTPSSKPELGYMENFTHLLQMPHLDRKKMVPIFKLFNVLHYDHCGGNLSTFVGKSVASGLAHLYSSLAAALTALSGPRHGRANQDCLEFVNEMISSAGENASFADVERFLRARLKNNQLIFGFGHAVLRVEDPRATVCYQYAERHFADHPLVRAALLLREVGPKVLSENPKITDPYPNIDAITGPLLMAAGFPHPEYYTLLFGLSRLVGIAIQIVYERMEARNGKGTPIMRPLYLYRSRK